ncbi:hypothetical protein A3D62_02975 [Candidatus Kaiserbacteria bacterium RIFCSPHIGHO2_02_FULL_49_11]|uniref:Probable queuosine precursor transporter n=1 Tax=Candidatus Kaiserbacteria bacterium RIFCSPHIGHO2_02_FULL_49_11 TaxID=1798489 RepID=A0A1F6D0L0_9BACT|nr:MAG: hypothetical protein A3D62_02975 [Candidatus Kaiserbacteria bacterium RIFCSPHIGHO2_02_FULL_49_11]
MKPYITDPAVSASYPHKYLGIFGMLWVTFLIVATFTATKTFSIGPVVFSVAILAYPFTYIFADIFTEVYGYRVTRKIVWTGFVCVLIASLVTYLYSIVPPSDSYTYNEAFRSIFLVSPIIAIATMLGFFGGELTNSYILAKLKIFTAGRWQGVRYIGSTLGGQFVDNTTFFLFAFLAAGVFTVSELLPLVLSSVAFTTIWETLILPITYRFIAFLKHAEGLDTYDKGTNFNPFAFRQLSASNLVLKSD